MFTERISDYIQINVLDEIIHPNGLNQAAIEVRAPTASYTTHKTRNINTYAQA